MNINKNLANFFNVNTAPEKENKLLVGGTFDKNNFQKDYEQAQIGRAHV